MANNQPLKDDELRVLELGSLVYPQPVAISCGRIMRSSSRSPESLVDEILKGAEILARYLAAVGLASYASREDVNGPLPICSELNGPLSFGTFLTVAQQAATSALDHPAKSYLHAGFRAKKRNNDIMTTDDALTILLNIRNELGHDLAGLTSPRAISLLRDKAPQSVLLAAFKGVEGFLQLPLFVIEQQQYTKRKIIGQRLLLMGETADPAPESVELSRPLQCDGEPYIGIGEYAVVLAPMLIWRISKSSSNYRLFVFDSIGDKSVKFKAVEVSEYESNDHETTQLQELLAGATRPSESLTSADGQSFQLEWGKQRQAIEQFQDKLRGRIPWQSFSQNTLSWYASKLSKEGDDVQQVIQAKLLDDREHLSKAEVDQLILLFGTEDTVKLLLGRELLDMQARKNPNVRWDERIESHANIIECLRTAVNFFSGHVGVGGVTIDGLKATSGSADYLAMREALVNLFIHQDYTDESAAAQVQIHPESVECFNTGKSLVKQRALIEGGKSQARNPLIARALRLIGFAELAGSGLRQLQYAWRTQRRRPPLMESDSSANTFTLTLDWRLVPNNYNSFWKDRLGVKLSETEATILNLSVDGLGVEEAASATGLALDSAQEALKTLVRQALVDEQKGRYFIKSHLRELMQADGNA